MKHLFSHRISFSSCERKCFLVINDLPKEELFKIYSKDQNPDQETLDTLKKRINFFNSQNTIDAPQKFSRENIYVNIFNRIILISNEEKQEISPYTQKDWVDYKNIWDYNKSYNIIPYFNAGFIIIDSIDLKTNIPDNYNVKIKVIKDTETNEVLPLGSTLLIFSDPRLIRADAFRVNGVDCSISREYDPDSMGQNVNISSKNTCFLILLIPKKHNNSLL